MRRWTALALVFAVLLGVLAGCSGAGYTAPTTPPRSSNRRERARDRAARGDSSSVVEASSAEEAESAPESEPASEPEASVAPPSSSQPASRPAADAPAEEPPAESQNTRRFQSYDENAYPDEYAPTLEIYADGTADFMVNLYEGMGNVYGTYEVEGDMLTMYFTERNFSGFLGDDLTVFPFRILDDNTLEYLGEDIGVNRTGDLFHAV